MCRRLSRPCAAISTPAATGRSWDKVRSLDMHKEIPMIARLRFLLALCLIVPSLAGAQNAPRPDADPRIEKIVASVSEERLKELLTKLVSFGTSSFNRSSDTDATIG